MLCIILASKGQGEYTYSLSLGDGIGALSAGLLLGLALLEKSLRDQDLVVGRDGTTRAVKLVRVRHTLRYEQERRCKNCS